MQSQTTVRRNAQATTSALSPIGNPGAHQRSEIHTGADGRNQRYESNPGHSIQAQRLNDSPQQRGTTTSPTT